MAERVVKVGLVLQASQYLAELDKVNAKTRSVGTEAEKLALKRQGFETLGRSAVVMGAAMAAGITLAVSRFAEFDKQMSAVQAATHESAETMGLLRDAAIDAGASTVFTATESAQAIEELAKAGIAATDILSGGLAGSLSLASAGAIGVGRAAEVAATAITQFNLSGEEVPHVADLFAAAAGKAQGGVEEMAQAFSQAGLVASQTGLSLEETTGTLAAFASAGLLGSDAGTSLRTMLLRLTPQSKEAADKMKELGFSAFDVNGEFIGMEALAAEVTDSFGNMDTETRNAAAGMIFGQDAIRGFNVVLDEGAAGMGDWIDKVDDTGYAALTAATRLDNLAGDLEKLGGAFDTALITSGSTANEVLRGSVQVLSRVVDGYNALPPAVQGTGMALGSVATAASLAAGAFFLAVPKIAAFQEALSSMGPRAQAAGRGLSRVGGILSGPWGIALSVGVGALLAFNEGQQKFNANAKLISETLDRQTGAITRSTREYVANRLAQEGAFEAAAKAGVGQRDLVDAVLSGGPAFDEVNSKLTAYNNELGNMFDAAAGEGFNSIRMLRDETEASGDVFNDLTSAMGDTSGAMDEAAVAAQENERAIADLGGAAYDAEVDIESLADAIRGFGSAQLDVNSANRAFEQAIDDLTASIAENGTELNNQEQAGRDNQAAIDTLAQSTLELAAATVIQTGNQEDANGVIATGRQRLIDMLAQFDITGDEAEAYADKLGLIPGNVTTAVDIATEGAQGELDRFFRLNNGRVISMSVKTNGTSRTPGFATGGYTGPGGKYDVAGVVHRGEFVMTKELTERYRRLFEYLHRYGSLPGHLPGYADGGYVRGSQIQYSAPAAVTVAGSFNVPGGGRMTGTLVLDSGELVGMINGVVRSGQGTVSSLQEKSTELSL